MVWETLVCVLTTKLSQGSGPPSHQVSKTRVAAGLVLKERLEVLVFRKGFQAVEPE